MRAYVAVFSEGGHLLAYSGRRDLVRKVAAEVRDLQYLYMKDPLGGELSEARRRILDKIAEGELGE